MIDHVCFLYGSSNKKSTTVVLVKTTKFQRYEEKPTKVEKHFKRKSIQKCRESVK